MTVLVLVETVVLAVLALLVAGLLRGYAAVLARLHQLDAAATRPGARGFELRPLSTDPLSTDPGAPVRAAVDEAAARAHDIAGESPLGELVSARVAGTEHDTLLLFLSSGCSSCATFWAELGGPVPLPTGTRLLVVAQSAADESLDDLRALAPEGIDVVLSSTAWSDYGVPGSPHAVLVDGRSGRVRGEGTGQSLQQLTALLSRSAAPSGATSTGAAELPRLPKSARDAEQEDAVDRELLAAGIVPGDARLYGGSAS